MNPLTEQHIGKTVRVTAGGNVVATMTVTDILFDRFARGTDEHGEARTFDMTDDAERFRFAVIA